MMASLDDRSTLHVEGKDDLYAISNLLVRYGIDYDQNPWPGCYPEIKDIGGKDPLIDGIETAVSVSNGRSIGFVLDANSALQDRWKAVSFRLNNVGVEVPDTIPPDGFIGETPTFQARVGVWLMPDNQREGTLECFLMDVIQENDFLLPYARESTEHARQLGARFSENDNNKAILHTWLAWQENPGLPYGSAIRTRYFRHDSPAAQSFVVWFRNLFNIDH
ncbi:MAG: hypothetical protein OXC84_05020 [Gammaproteobacteria bacterium]|nr:hypothetical protein [Gammaproteobacteria bacterium]